MSGPNPRCPDCGHELRPVTYSSNSYLNRDQWESIRAGDWFCSTCPSNGRGNSNLRYFWQSELEHPIGQATVNADSESLTK